MLVLSSSSPPIVEVLSLRDRVSSSISSSTSFAVPVVNVRRISTRRTSSSLLFCYCSSSSSTIQVVGASVSDDDDEEERERRNKFAMRRDNELLHSRTFLDVRTGEELLSGIKRESEFGRLPVNVASAMEELYQNYRNAVLSSGVPRADEIVLSNMSSMLDLVLLDVEVSLVN